MSRLTDLVARAKASDPRLGKELEDELQHLMKRQHFGLVFERHLPEAVELPNKPVRPRDKVRILPPRGSKEKGDSTLWKVQRIVKTGAGRAAELVPPSEQETELAILPEIVPLEDLVVVAEVTDTIYPGLVETGRVERGAAEDPYHTVINAENFHALEMLTYTHRHAIDAIYIDPPYNTGSKDWKYNNDYVEGDDDYRHSKWLSMMERRLFLAKELLNPDDSVLIVTIDEKEVHRLALLLEQTFPEASMQMVSSQINPAASARAGSFGRVDEYIFFVRFGASTPQRLSLGREWVSAKGRTHTGLPRWDMLRRSGGGARRQDSPGGFYPVYIDPAGPRVTSVGSPLPSGTSTPKPVEGSVAVLPIRKDGSEGRWMWSAPEFERRLAQGRVRITGNVEKGFVISILKDGEYAKVLGGEFQVVGRGSEGALLFEKNQSDLVRAIPGTQWRIGAHDATQYGTRLLTNFLPDRKFPFPKSLYAVEDALRFFVKNKPDAKILDFFAGSGTTAHAVMRLNRQDGGRRQSLSVTNNEVSAEEQDELRKKGLRPGDPEWEELGICDYITKPRIRAAITGATLDGKPVKGDYKFTDEFLMSEGFSANAVFFTLTYENSLAIAYHKAFEKVAPLLWLRAGSTGRMISHIPEKGWDVADTYAILEDLDRASDFIDAISEQEQVRIAYIVTDDDRRFQMIGQSLPSSVEPVRLYQSYLLNFQLNNGRGIA